MLCLRASPSLHQSRGHMKGHIAFAEAFSHGSLPLGLLLASVNPRQPMLSWICSSIPSIRRNNRE